jgi:predicted amidohydrolase YtcJ
MKRIFILLFFFSLFTQAQEKADLIIFNGKIATMQKSNEFVQAIASKNGIILATGTSKSILENYKTATTQAIDAKGKNGCFRFK